MATTNFIQAFEQAFADIERDAKAAGSSLSEICRETGISRTTPDRWRAKTPTTVELVARMQECVAKKLAVKQQAEK
jgi:transposase-like protein